MPDDIQKSRDLHPTNPDDGHGRRGLNRHPGVQFYDGYPWFALRFPHVCHRAYQREDRHREGVHEAGCSDLGSWCCDGVVGDVLRLVYRMT